MSDVTRRLSRWKAKYSPEIAAQTTARIYADMTERYQASMVALCTMETETKQTLDASGIDTMYIVFYLDFARQLFRLSHGRSISGPTLAREAQVLLEKWTARGGDTSATRSSRRSVDVSPSARPCGNPLRGLQRAPADALAVDQRPMTCRLIVGGGPSPAPPCLPSTVYCLLGTLPRHHDLPHCLRLEA
jgi:hypothetical protein